MPAPPDDGLWFSPKWPVALVALATWALVMGYDLRLGIAAGILLGVIAALWLYIALRYGSLSDGPPRKRKAIVAQFLQQQSNRRRAAARLNDAGGAAAGSDPDEG
jgi:hypothetical protein